MRGKHVRLFKTKYAFPGRTQNLHKSGSPHDTTDKGNPESYLADYLHRLAL